MLILGLDPSSTSTGYGLVRVPAKGQRLQYEDCGCLRPANGASFAQRLLTLHEGLTDLLQRTRPDTVALESSYYGRDADAAAKLGEARGVLRLALVQAGLDTALYSPAVVKKSVVGSGQASKEAVRDMVTRLLGLPAAPDSLDASDALAVAICHHHRQPLPATSGSTASRRPDVEALLRRVTHR